MLEFHNIFKHGNLTSFMYKKDIFIIFKNGWHCLSNKSFSQPAFMSVICGAKIFKMDWTLQA